MERFKKTFSFRKKKDHVPESSKPHQWQEDEQKVRDGTCSFQVRVCTRKFYRSSSVYVLSDNAIYGPCKQIRITQPNFDHLLD